MRNWMIAGFLLLGAAAYGQQDHVVQQAAPAIGMPVVVVPSAPAGPETRATAAPALGGAVVQPPATPNANDGLHQAAGAALVPHSKPLDAEDAKDAK